MSYLSYFNEIDASHLNLTLPTPQVVYIENSDDLLLSSGLEVDTCNIIPRSDGSYFLGSGNCIFEYESDAPYIFDVRKIFNDYKEGYELMVLNGTFTGESWSNGKGAIMMDLNDISSGIGQVVAYLNKTGGGTEWLVSLGHMTNGQDVKLNPTAKFVTKFKFPEIPVFAGQVEFPNLKELIFPECQFEASFALTSGIEVINIPKNVKFSVNTFKNCPNLILNIDPEHTMYSKENNVVYGSVNSEVEVLYIDRNLSEIIIPNTVTSYNNIKNYLPEVLDFFDTGDGIKYLSSGILKDKQIKRIRIGNNVQGYKTNSTYSLFRTSGTQSSYEYSLEIVDLDGSMGGIRGGSFFRGCASLHTVNISTNVKAIPGYLFYGCLNLSNINYAGTMEQWNAVTKGTLWNYKVPATYVQCTDGQVEL